MLKALQQAVCAERFENRARQRQARLGSLRSLMAGAPVDPGAIEPLDRQRERARLLEAARAPLGSGGPLPQGRRVLEAVVGQDDRLPRVFLAQGDRTASAVCRILTLTEAGQPSLGTGFSVGRGLVLTNNHVLPSPQSASRGQAEFGYWSDAADAQGSRIALPFDPGRFFLTDLHLDFTLVALAGDAGAALDEAFGRIALLPQSGKALVGEPVNVIQHGGGRAQSVSLRDNLVVDVFDDWVHYTSDTDEGASGAPVLNDQWQLAALHHAAFEYTTSDGRRVTVNEGTRISSIASALDRMLS